MNQACRSNRPVTLTDLALLPTLLFPSVCSVKRFISGVSPIIYRKYEGFSSLKRGEKICSGSSLKFLKREVFLN